MKLKNENLKIAVQKEGRLTEETISFLQKSGLEFESYKQRLFSICRNFPLEILFVRDDDIPGYVSAGTVDLGIIGQNVLYETKSKVRKLFNLRYGYCSLTIAIPKESSISSVDDLKYMKIATSYPNSTNKFFRERGIPVNTVSISGSVEIAPSMGIAQAIVDLTSTGSTLALNDLKILEKIYDSEAVLIVNPKALNNGRKKMIESLLIRFKGVLNAKDYKYVMMNAPEEILSRLAKITPGLCSPTVTSLTKKGWISVQTVIRENIFWETIDRLKKAGASGIIVMPIEKMII
jgi:ATP phosphoribosyltransferase